MYIIAVIYVLLGTYTYWHLWAYHGFRSLVIIWNGYNLRGFISAYFITFGWPCVWLDDDFWKDNDNV